MSVGIALAYEAYVMRHVETGVALYQTIATPDEIAAANNRLREAGNSNRFSQDGTFSIPSLHDTCPYVPGNDSPESLCYPPVQSTIS